MMRCVMRTRAWWRNVAGAVLLVPVVACPLTSAIDATSTTYPGLSDTLAFLRDFFQQALAAYVL